MPLSAKERMRQHRARLKQNNSAYLEHKEKERERWHERKQKKKVKTIDDMTAAEKQNQRRRWRRAYRIHQRRLKKLKEINTFLDLNSPPTSPGFDSSSENDRRRGSGRPKVRRDRAKAYRELNTTKSQLEKQKRLTQKYRKRLNRISKLNKQHNRKTNGEDISPRKKVQSLLAKSSLPKSAKKNLLVNYGIVAELKKRIEKSNKKEKALLSRIVSGNILKKYRLVQEAKKELSLTERQFERNKTITKWATVQENKRNRLNQSTQEKVRQFFKRDDNSRMTAGKKETITVRKIKKQKRLLLDSVKSLHKKYQKEHLGEHVSLSTFRKLKPFWIISPTARDRDTCLCRIHDNVKLLVDSLISRKALDVNMKQVSVLCEAITCSQSKACMYRECRTCVSQTLKANPNVQTETKMVWFQWKTERSQYVDRKGTEKSVQKTVKIKCEGTISDAVNMLQSQMKRFCVHVYNIRRQYKACHTLKEDLQTGHAIIHIDFAENFVGRYAEEIQSVHFGGSHQQSCLPFCTISNLLRHDPIAIWSYLDPVLTYLKMHHDHVQHLHFQSDGPTTQYRNRKNFYLMATKPFDLGFHDITWSFWESGHGKGAPDGVGAVIKRTADTLINQGHDITDAESLFHALEKQQVAVKLFYVGDSDIVEEQIPDDLVPVPETMKIHEAFTDVRGSIQSRELSCFCTFPVCPCFAPKVTKFCPEDATSDSPTPTIEVNPHASLQEVDPNAHPSTLVGKLCVVSYDGRAYPGRIAQSDVDGVEVSTMQPIGENKFIWPSREDKIWYGFNDIVTLTDNIEKITTRRDIYQVPVEVWRAAIEKI